MQMAVASTLLIEELAMAVWQQNHCILTFSAFVDIAHRYSREMEHSDINLNRIEETVKQKECFQLKNLLKVINEIQ